MSLKEFFLAIFFPRKLGISQIDSEKWLTIGLLPILLALIGFLILKKRYKILVLSSSLIILLISLNNLSPIYQFIISRDWFVLMRVETRIWFILQFVIIFLAGFALNFIYKKRLIRLPLLLIVFLLIALELLLLSWNRLTIPIKDSSDHAPKEVYEFLKRDKEKFRIFCLTRCLSQRQAAMANLELVEGYNTLQQKNYFDYFIQLSQVFWDRYTLPLPPFEIYLFRQIQPLGPTLADYNVKYIITPYKLTGKDFKLAKQFETYLVYENMVVKPRAYFLIDGSKSEIEAPIIHYSPNRIRLDASKQKAKQVILAEVWSPGWKAYLNGNEETMVNETRNALRMVEIKPDTQFVEFLYQPGSFILGRSITAFSLIVLFGVGSFLVFAAFKNQTQGAS